MEKKQKEQNFPVFDNEVTEGMVYAPLRPGALGRVAVNIDEYGRLKLIPSYLDSHGAEIQWRMYHKGKRLR